MSELTIEDLDNLIDGADSSLAQLLALQLKKKMAERDAATLEYDVLNDQIKYWHEQAKALQQNLDAVAAKGMELASEAAHVYSKYNDTQMPDRDLVDMQTIQEFSDLANDVTSVSGFLNGMRAEGVQQFISYLGELAHEYPHAMVAKSLEITELNSETFINMRLRAGDADKAGE